VCDGHLLRVTLSLMCDDIVTLITFSHTNSEEQKTLNFPILTNEEPTNERFDVNMRSCASIDVDLEEVIKM